MGYHRLFYENPKVVRDTLNGARELAMKHHELETQLVGRLKEIDRKRYFVRYGFNSLRMFCIKDLKFTKTQAQRLVTRARHDQGEQLALTPFDLTLFDDGQHRGLAGGPAAGAREKA